MKKYTITITASCYGTREEFYSEFSRGNREVIIENTDFEGEEEQHNSGYIVEDFETDKSLKDFMKNYFLENLYLEIEYFSIREREVKNK